MYKTLLSVTLVAGMLAVAGCLNPGVGTRFQCVPDVDIVLNEKERVFTIHAINRSGLDVLMEIPSDGFMFTVWYETREGEIETEQGGGRVGDISRSKLVVLHNAGTNKVLVGGVNYEVACKFPWPDKARRIKQVDVYIISLPLRNLRSACDSWALESYLDKRRVLIKQQFDPLYKIF